MSVCTAVDDGRQCGQPVADDTPIALCTRHLLVAHDWIVRDVGVTDLLPAPCLACGSRLGVSYPSGWLCAICEWRMGELPDEHHVSPRVDVVYYLRYRDRIKIGTSGNPRQRLAAIVHDELLAFEPGDRSLEQHRHAQFARHRLGHTEWFAANDELDAHITRVARGVSDPWERYARWVSEAIALQRY